MSVAALRFEELEGADRIWHLRQAVLLKGLSVPDLTAISRICSDRIYSKGEVIFSQDDVADAIFILNRGCVRRQIEFPQRRLEIPTQGLKKKSCSRPLRRPFPRSSFL